jgi:hypothetical protein
MKNVIFILFSTAIYLGCAKEYVAPVTNNQEFINALVNNDNPVIKTEMDKVLAGLNSVPSLSDVIGQQDNVSIAVRRLNSYTGLSAELICYACIKTNPPQSEIKVTIKDQQLVRFLDVSTGETLTYAGVH